MNAPAANGTGGWPFWVLSAAFFLIFVAVMFTRRLPIRRVSHELLLRPKPGQSKGCSFVAGGLLVAVGALAFFLILLRPVYRAYRADNWPTTDGVVLSSKLARTESKNSYVYRVEIRYRYTAEGRAYESDQYDSGGRGSTNVGVDAMRAAVKARPAGARVTVYYNPRDPADAMLSTDLRAGTLTFGWLPLVLVVIGGVLIITGSRVDKANRPLVPSPSTPGEG